MEIPAGDGSQTTYIDDALAAEEAAQAEEVREAKAKEAAEAEAKAKEAAEAEAKTKAKAPK